MKRESFFEPNLATRGIGQAKKNKSCGKHRIISGVFVSLQAKIAVMHLVIDQGNTTIKTALFSGEGNPDRIERIPRLTRSYIDKLLARYPVTGCIYSSVAHADAEMCDYLQSQIARFFFFTADTPLPVTIDYRTPRTLGSDRVAAAVGAHAEMPDKDLLVVDAGTCITYDIITSRGHFLGGNIAPGIKMRLKAMHKYTERLPIVEKNGDTPLVGYDTETAMRSGAVFGVCHEIEGYISHLKQEYPELLIFLTGGDAFLLADKLKTAIFVDDCIVLKGLNRILHHNVQP